MFELDAIRSQLEGTMPRVRAAGSSLDAAEWVAVVGECQQLLAMLGAVQTMALAQLAATDEVVREDGTIGEEFRGLGHQRLDAPALVHDLLGLTPSGATDRLATAVEVVTRHDGLFEAMCAGRIEPQRARVVADELRDADPEICAQVVSRIEASAAPLGTEAGGALRRRVQRILATIDADLLRRRAEKARSECSLRRTSYQPGVDEWSATLPVESSREAWSVVDDVARRYVKDGAFAGLEQARGHAMLDLILARASGTITLQIAVPASELAAAAAASDPASGTGTVAEVRSADDQLVSVTGFGMPGVTHVRASWLRSVAGFKPATDSAPMDSTATNLAAMESTTMDSAVTVVACTDRTGALASLPLSAIPNPLVRRSPSEQVGASAPASPPAQPGSLAAVNSYTPTTAMVEFVKARDGHCRFPGCTISARFCDVDHVRPWPAGRTEPANLMCLCRRHHRTKQRPSWRVRIEPDSSVTWTDPFGVERTTLPIDHLRATDATDGCDRVDGAGCEVAEPPEPPAAPPPTVPSRVAENIEHLLRSRLVELACRPEHLTARNRRALRRGEPVSTRPVESALRHFRCGPYNGLRVAHALVTEPTAELTVATRRDDGPPPF